jgi:hypothetical protein
VFRRGTSHAPIFDVGGPPFRVSLELCVATSQEARSQLLVHRRGINRSVSLSYGSIAGDVDTNHGRTMLWTEVVSYLMSGLPPEAARA